MADNTEASPKEGGEGEVVPEVVETPEEPKELSPVEELAQKAGWTPKEKFDGNPEKWRPADEYLLANKDTIRSVSRELKSVKKQMGAMSQVSQQLFEQQLADRDAYWEGRYREAVEGGDHAGANQANQQRAILRQQAQSVPLANDPPAESLEFARRNKWLGQDPLATRRALEVCQAYAEQGKPADEQLAAAERVVRKEYPELFSQPAKPAASVNQPERTSGRSSGKKGFHDLPSDAQKAAKMFLETQGVPLEKYAEGFFKAYGGNRA